MMTVYMVCSSLTVFGQSIAIKSTGLFLQGFLHLKIMLSYTHMFELTDEKSKSFCSTFITSVDSGSFLF